MAATTVYVPPSPEVLAPETRSVASEPRALRMHTLVLCRDEDAIQKIHPILLSAESSVQLCRDPELALQMLSRWRFDAIVVDCDGFPKALDVLSWMRKSSSSRAAVAFALLDHMPASFAFGAGASFVLNKPVNREQLRRMFAAARGLMILANRRYHRRPLVIPATFVTVSRQPLQLSTVNVSEGGVRVKSSHPLCVGSYGTISFKLPAMEVPIIARAEVVWSKHEEAGLRFVNIANGGAAALREWISRSFAVELATMKPAAQNC